MIFNHLNWSPSEQAFNWAKGTSGRFFVGEELSNGRADLKPKVGNDWDDDNEDENEDEREKTKRKSRNQSEKKRRDQFNILINELMTLVAGTNRKMDKSTVLQATISFLKRNKEMSSQHCQQEEVTETLKPKYISNAEFSLGIQINIMLSWNINI